MKQEDLPINLIIECAIRTCLIDAVTRTVIEKPSIAQIEQQINASEGDTDTFELTAEGELITVIRKPVFVSDLARAVLEALEAQELRIVK